MEKLKPCPFCGEDAFTWGIVKRIKVTCNSDCVTMPSQPDTWFTDEEQAIKAWNTRKIAPPRVHDVEDFYKED